MAELPEKECSWQKLRQGDVEVCSSPEVVMKMSAFLRSIGKKIASNSAPEIVDEMKKATGCKSESCAVQNTKFREYASPYLIEQNLKENFKTKGPAHSTEWLSNFDIDDVLNEIRVAYADQKFWNIPFQMRDFAKNEKWSEESNLSTFDFVDKYKEGYRCFGVVINTDYSTGSGIHWFCIFVCMRHENITIEYFNSSGEPPLDEIEAWMKKTRFTLAKTFTDRPITTIISKEQHQTDNHSCGVYSLYYIISRVANIPFDYFQKNIVGAKEIRSIRSRMFRSDI